MNSHKFLEIQNPVDANLVLPPINGPSPMNNRKGGDMNLIMMPNHKRGGHFHLRSRSNAENIGLAVVPSSKNSTH